MRYRTIIPATSWYYVHGAEAGHPETVWHLVAFGLTEEDDIVGLVAVPAMNGKPAHLVTPPPAHDGRFLHHDQLTAEQQQAAKEV